ncbi:MAG: hypothetical protein K0Q95_2205 [Bacteroidota bacterium]|jgi:hypothetical protein|nr:hypothetical protein [Bacteroidota bacterium]
MNSGITRSFPLSKWTIVLVAVFWLSAMYLNQPWKKNQITNDVVSYYSYLPATFIYHDLSLKFVENNSFFGDKFWPKDAPNGGKVIKMSAGLSILYAPFFFLGHFTAPLFHQPQDGFSMPYQVCLNISSLFYLLLGLFYLRRILLMFFTEGIVAITLLSVYFGTNLLWYSTVDGLMSHGYLFCIINAFAYHTILWHNSANVKRAIFIGLLAGLMTLVRPTLIICTLFFVFYDVYNKKSLFIKIERIKQNLKSILAIIICFLLVQLPQLLYWKYVTGSWFFFSYIGERFYFNDAHVLEGLFSFRKGWLLYTPIMILALAGIVFLKRDKKVFVSAITVPLLISIYVIFSWWCWWYGGSFSQRAMVDFYGLLSIPLAALYEKMFIEGRILIKSMMSAIIILLISLNLYQTKQFEEGMIHYDSMTRKSYLTGFFLKLPTVEWYESLEDPDYDRLVQGYPEKISESEIAGLKEWQKIALKAWNLKAVSCEVSTTGDLDAVRYERGPWERFSIIHVGGNKIALRADNGKYVSSDREKGWKLVADRENIGGWEIFELIYLGNNRVALKADNQKYVSVGEEPESRLVANGESISKRETFKIYISYKK